MLLELANVLELILPNVPPPLISPHTLPSLIRVAAAIPPLLGSASLEIRLGENDTRVDLLTGNPAGELAELAEYFDTRADNPMWRRLAALSRDQAHDDMQVLILEFDCLPGGDISPPMPLVRFAREGTANGTVRQSAVRVLDHLVGEVDSKSMLPWLDRCLTVLPRGAFLEYIGVMPDRDVNALRVVVGIDVEALRPFLEAMQWEGDHQVLESVMSDLAPYTAWQNIQFDLGTTMSTRVGVAGYHHYTSQSYTTFLGAFETLVERGLCTSAKRDAVHLLHRKAITPLSEHAAYPAPLIIESLRRSESHLTQFRIMAHSIKVIYTPDVSLEAKVYVNFAHHWGPYANR
jgi:hypothetical protein